MYEKELHTAIEAVRQACGLCRAVQHTLVSEETIQKKDRSPVTVADYGSQAVINAALIAATPGIPIVAEEDARALRNPDNRELLARVAGYVRTVVPDTADGDILDAIDAGIHDGTANRFWTLDPIDGTKGFIRGGQYAVALALIENGRIALGVLGCPNLACSPPVEQHVGCILYAVRGGGAFEQSEEGGDARAISVDSVARSQDLTFCESVESGHTSHDRTSQIAQKLGVANPPVRLDSQCKYALVARGEAGVYLRLPSRKEPSYRQRIWDHAAGVLIVQAAGGIVSDVDGSELDFTTGRCMEKNLGIVASNARVHAMVVEAVMSVVKS
ncbi:MAG: 3'(2'),5'-bisphosphate nucleotidase [Verrucomicrobia bacterium]|nr:3'(2'),5'-bisphosphate nucleotidase [Verrucomicrobiota bacterium]